MSLSYQYLDPLMGYQAATGLRPQKLARYSGLHQSGHSLQWHFTVLLVAPMGCSLFWLQAGVLRFLSLFGWSCPSQDVKIPPSLHYVREMGEDIWPVEPRYAQTGQLWLLCRARRSSWGFHQPPVASWACSQGVRSLNLGTFLCFTWFKTKNLVEAHCSKRKIPSNNFCSVRLLIGYFVKWSCMDIYCSYRWSKIWQKF